MIGPLARPLLLACCLVAAGAARGELNCNVGIEFYPRGGVRGCTLNGHHRIHVQRGLAVRCADGRRLEQHPDGSLAHCTLHEPAVFDGRACPKDAKVRFDPHGILIECKPGNAS
jgi:hypothetical protein